jgi:hypothetical protein
MTYVQRSVYLDRRFHIREFRPVPPSLFGMAPLAVLTWRLTVSHSIGGDIRTVLTQQRKRGTRIAPNP